MKVTQSQREKVLIEADRLGIPHGDVAFDMVRDGYVSIRNEKNTQEQRDELGKIAFSITHNPPENEYGEIKPLVVTPAPERQFTTGAIRDNAEMKGRWDLLPFRTLQRLAVHFEKGAKRYADRNWEKGIPVGEYLNSCLRHLWKWWLGWDDEDHLAAFAWNAICLVETAERIRIGALPKELDNRPELGKATPDEQKKDHTS